MPGEVDKKREPLADARLQVAFWTIGHEGWEPVHGLPAAIMGKAPRYLKHSLPETMT